VSENQVFLEAAERRITECIPEIGPLYLRYSMEQSVLDSLPSFLQLPFVTSFSREDDSLTHWRSYCSAGNGVSIGFRTANLLVAEAKGRVAPHPGQIVPEPRLGEIFYIDPNNLEIVDAVINLVHQEASDFIAEHNQPPEIMARELTWRLKAAAAFFKDHSFMNEREFRLRVDGAGWRPDILRFRTARTTLVPYIPLTIPIAPSGSFKGGEPEPWQAWNAIASITVGPTPNMSLSLEAVLAICQVYGICPTVKPSRVPYRDW
jgi:Protein of unknown function (DUF2971)